MWGLPRVRRHLQAMLQCCSCCRPLEKPTACSANTTARYVPCLYPACANMTLPGTYHCQVSVIYRLQCQAQYSTSAVHIAIHDPHPFCVPKPLQQRYSCCIPFRKSTAWSATTTTRYVLSTGCSAKLHRLMSPLHILLMLPNTSLDCQAWTQCRAVKPVWAVLSTQGLGRMMPAIQSQSLMLTAVC